MSNTTGQFTITGTGTLNISSLGFNPNDLEFIVGPKNNASSVNTKCIGTVDSAGNQAVVYDYDDRAGGTGPFAYNRSTSQCIWIVYHNGTTWVNALKASFNGYITGGFSLTVTAADTNYPVQVKARTT